LNICIGHPAHSDDRRGLVQRLLIPGQGEEPILVIDLTGDHRAWEERSREEEAAGVRYISPRRSPQAVRVRADRISLELINKRRKLVLGICYVFWGKRRRMADVRRP
jgi:hypothetical protein